MSFFTLHRKQQKQIKDVFLSMRSYRRKKSTLMIVRGPRGCGKTFELHHSLSRIFKSSVTRIWNTRDVLSLLEFKHTIDGLYNLLFAKKMFEPTPQYCILNLDDVQCEASQTQLTTIIQFCKFLLEKESVPISTLIILSCQDLFHEPAQKFQALLPQRVFKTKKKRKQSESKKASNITKDSVIQIVLYAPNATTIKCFLGHYSTQKALVQYVHNCKKTEPKLSREDCIQRLIHLCQGDIRQLLLIVSEPLATSTCVRKDQPTLRSALGIFPFISTLYSGGTQSWTKQGACDEDEDDDDSVSFSTESRTQTHVSESISNAYRCFQESPERILDFIHANRFLLDDKLQDVGPQDLEQEHKMMKYHCDMADDFSVHDLMYSFPSSSALDFGVRSVATRTGQLGFESYELDDTAKVQVPRQSIGIMIKKQKQTRKAREAILEACVFEPGQKAIGGSVFTRANGQDYLDFLNTVIGHSDANYRNLSDLLQTVPGDQVADVFPKKMKAAIVKRPKLYVPF